MEKQSRQMVNQEGKAFTLSLHNLARYMDLGGCSNPHKNWEAWVNRMKPLHQSTWHKVGIYDAIIASTYSIRTDKDIILALSERWCSQTESFIFPWGKVAFSLEDVMVLGGFPILGDSLLGGSPNLGNSFALPFSEDKEIYVINEDLVKGRAVAYSRTRGNKVGVKIWIELFMNTGSKVEHEAFLVLWLSRYVFPRAKNMVFSNIHEIAIHLARGTRIALGPAVLSCLYKDLTLLKQLIAGGRVRKKFTLWSQMWLVQIWAWERFPKLGPQPNLVGEGEPRMACWKNLAKRSNVENVRTVIRAAADSFIWHPYAVFEKNEEPYFPLNLFESGVTETASIKKLASIVDMTATFGQSLKGKKVKGPRSTRKRKHYPKMKELQKQKEDDLFEVAVTKGSDEVVGNSAVKRELSTEVKIEVRITRLELLVAELKNIMN